MILVLAKSSCALAGFAAKLNPLYHVTTVYSAKAANRYLGKVKFDLIIVDESMEISSAFLELLAKDTAIYRPKKDIGKQKFLNEVVHQIEGRFLDPQLSSQEMAKNHARHIRRKLGVAARLKPANRVARQNSDLNYNQEPTSLN